MKKSTKPKPAPEHRPLSDYWNILSACTHLGFARSTIVSAIARGQIPTHATGDGTQMVLLEDLQHYIATSPGRGGNRQLKKAD